MKKKKYWEMTPEELEKATQQFDEPFVADKSRPLTKVEKEQWQKIQNKRGWPKRGLGYQRISLSIERGLLRQATALAKKRRISRSQLVAQALATALSEDKE